MKITKAKAKAIFIANTMKEGDTFVNSSGNTCTIIEISRVLATNTLISFKVQSETGTTWIINRANFIDRTISGIYKNHTYIDPTVFKDGTYSPDIDEEGDNEEPDMWEEANFNELWGNVITPEQRFGIWCRRESEYVYHTSKGLRYNLLETYCEARGRKRNNAFTKELLKTLFAKNQIKLISVIIKEKQNEKSRLFETEQRRDSGIQNLLSSRKRPIAAASRLVGNTTMYSRKRGEINSGKIKQGILPYLIS